MNESKFTKSFFKINNILSFLYSAKYAVGFLGIALVIGGSFYFFYSNSRASKTILKNYLQAKSWEERLKYVRNPEVVKPFMSEWYEKVDFSKGKPFLRLEFQNDVNPESLKVGDWLKIKAVFNEGNNAFGVPVQEATWYSLLLTEEGFKIDWESSVVYNPMTFKVMEVLKPTKPQKFRVYAEIDSYYNLEFRGSEQLFYSVRLSEPDSFKSIYGYVKKDSIDGKNIFEILKDGKKHPVILMIRYPEFATSSDLVIIDQFVQEHFLELAPGPSTKMNKVDKTKSIVNSISVRESSAIESKIKEIGSQSSFKFDIKLISNGFIKEKPFKLVEVQYTYPEIPHPRQCTYILYHHDQEAGMLTSMIIGLSDYQKGGCSMDTGCFGCGDKSLYQTIIDSGYTGEIVKK